MAVRWLTRAAMHGIMHWRHLDVGVLGLKPWVASKEGSVGNLQSQSGALNCIYFALVVAGVIYALGILILGQIGGDGGDGSDAGGGDVDGGDTGDLTGGSDLRIFSPVTVATFATVFGATGLVATLGLGMGAGASLLVAAIVATAMSLLVAYVYSKLLVELHGSTDIREADMIGMVGQVTTPIPAQGLGEVLYEIAGERGVKPARTAGHDALSRGTTVVVEEVVGGVLVVRPREPVA